MRSPRPSILAGFDWFAFHCPPCALVSDEFPDPAVAEYLAGLHDDLHHNGAPTALMTAGTDPKGARP
jgi:hypothetical protein